MDNVLDPEAVFHRGLHDIASLQPFERLVYILMLFETDMEMEGWDDFFSYEHSISLYPEMKDWLRTIEDLESLAVLEDYEDHLRGRGVPLSPDELNQFLSGQNDNYFKSCPDWRANYMNLVEPRWERVGRYLETQGVKLKTD